MDLFLFPWTRFEQAYVSSLIYGWEDEYFWTALQDINETGSFHWLSGDEVTYTHWNRNQPGKSLYHVPTHKSISIYTHILCYKNCI